MANDPIAIATGGLFSGTGISEGSRGLLQDPSQESPPTIIRRHVASILSGQSAAADRVVASHVRPQQIVPGDHVVLVYAGDETAERISSSNMLHRHRLELLVEVYGMGPDPEELLGQLEAIGRVAVVLVMNDTGLIQAADEIDYVGREWEKDPDGRMTGQAIRFRFSVTYRTDYGVLLADDFLTLGLGFDVDGDGVVDTGTGSGLDLDEQHQIRV